jgi:hypothetical protein
MINIAKPMIGPEEKRRTGSARSGILAQGRESFLKKLCYSGGEACLQTSSGTTIAHRPAGTWHKSGG